MSAAPRAAHPETWDWRTLASLGEQLVSTGSLSAQRDRILSVMRQLVSGEADVWLHETLFRLPDWDETRLFPHQPPHEGMRRATQRKRLYS